MGVRNLLALIGVVGLLVAAPCAAEEGKPRRVTDPPSVAISPAWAHALLPRSVSADGVGLGIALNPGGRAADGRLAFALVGALYGPFSSEARRQTVAFPLNETLGHLSLETRYAVLKRSSFELSPVGGVGMVATRPVSVIDPEYRRFDYHTRLAMTLGAVLHGRLAAHVLLGIEVRDLVYVEQHENSWRAPTQRASPDTWFGNKPLTHMIECRLGLTFVLGGGS